MCWPKKPSVQAIGPDERGLRQTYLPAFEACVKEAQAASVMGAYNRANGEPCCASPTLLGKILRDEWGFDGHVVSDCGAIRDIYAHHHVVEMAAEAAALVVRHGCDLNCGEVYPALLELVRQGLISEDAIDRAVQRLFKARFRLGMFEPPEQVSYAQIPYDLIDSPAHRELALQAARESIVLLKNEDNMLPLDKNVESIAIFGLNADNLRALLSNYNGAPNRPVTPLAGIRQKISSETRLYYARGGAIAEGVPFLSIVPSAFLRPMDAGTNETGLMAD
jgi:beta-glucosidase